MQYEVALREWGALRLEGLHSRTGVVVDRSTVSVRFDFDEGYACCGGSDPNCYCSFAESPRAEVVVTGRTVGDERSLHWSLPASDFDFASVLSEIVAAGDGLLES